MYSSMMSVLTRLWVQEGAQDLVGGARIDVVVPAARSACVAASALIRYSTAGIACWLGAAPV